MANPYAGQAMSSSKERMRRVSGRGGGGGSPFKGSSGFKKYDAKHGETGSYDSHAKKYVGKAHGGRAKARADFRRGGKVGMAGGGRGPRHQDKPPILFDPMTAWGPGGYKGSLEMP